MATAIQNLWPEHAIVVDALTPLAIMRSQVPPLREMTRGLLDAEITSVSSDKQIQHRFDVVAPALNDYRHRLFSCKHAPDLVYPVTVEAEGLHVAMYTNSADIVENTAYSESDFQKLLTQVLRAPATVAVLQSLVAQSNETRQPDLAGVNGAGATEEIESETIDGTQT